MGEYSALPARSAKRQEWQPGEGLGGFRTRLGLEALWTMLPRGVLKSADIRQLGVQFVRVGLAGALLRVVLPRGGPLVTPKRN